MATPILPQLKALLAQIEALDLHEPDPELQQQLAMLAAVATGTQSLIQKRHKTEPLSVSEHNMSQDTDSSSSASVSSFVPTAIEPPSQPAFNFPSVPTALESSPSTSAVADGPFSVVTTLGGSPTVYPSARTTVGSMSSPSKFPWISADLAGQKPSETAFANPGEPRQFGMPLRGILPLEPPMELFVWSAESISKLGKPEANKLIPAPAAPAPPVGFPQAPTYLLNSEPDLSYRRGYRYAAPFYITDRLVERDHMLNIQMPPNVKPPRFDHRTQLFHCDPIPGMVRLPIGIPLVHHVEGNPKRAITAVCAHTLDSLMQYEEGPKVKALIPHLMTLTWGIAKSESHPGTPGIFELTGMQKNLCSKHVDLTKLLDGDGSFNLASTHGEGEGMWDMLELNGLENNVIAFGGIEPGPTSCQLNSSSAADIFDIDLPEAAGPTLSDTDIEPASPSSMPCDVHDQEPAGPPPTPSFPADNELLPILMEPSPPFSPTPKPSVAPPQEPPKNPLVQPSSRADVPPPHTAYDVEDPVPPEYYLELGDILRARIRGILREQLGKQGGPHGDFKDDALAFTLFALMFRVAPGSDLGVFLWMRGGIYLRELNEFMFFTSFKAQDIHMGSAPTYIKKIQEAWMSMDAANSLFKRFGPQIRCGYVMYPSMAATSHSTQIMYSPSLHFLHSPAPNPRDVYRKYYNLDGDTVLGTVSARANRLGIEGIYCLKNFFLQSRLKLGLSINTLLENTTYIDEDGKTQSLQPSSIDVEDDEAYEMICLYRRFYFWFRDVIAEYSLGVTKPQFKEKQTMICSAVSEVLKPQKTLPTERRVLPNPRRHQTQTDTFPLINHIISRRQHGAELYHRQYGHSLFRAMQNKENFLSIKLIGKHWFHGARCLETHSFFFCRLTREPNRLKCLEYLKKHGASVPAEPTPAMDISETPVTHVPDTGSSVVSPLGITSSEAIVPGINLDSLAQTSGGTDSHVPIVADQIPVGDDTNSATGRPTDNADSSLPMVTEVVGDVGGTIASRKRKRRMVSFSDSDEGSTREQPEASQKPSRKKTKQVIELESESEYEVEDILEACEEDGKWEWLVRWKGCDSSNDMWLDEDQLGGAQDLLKEFTSRHSLSRPDLVRSTSPSSSSDISRPSSPESSSDEYHKPPVQKATSARAERINRLFGTDTEAAQKLEAKELNRSYLDKLLNPAMLKSECSDLEVGQDLLTKSSKFHLAGETLQALAARIIDQIEHNNKLSTQMYFEQPSLSLALMASHSCHCTASATVITAAAPGM
ncbi:hypothetical protein DFH09DRAFT_1096986 [Mycena vulgaris]|nr:hypothetical protein DFH09DRAFT_1096986 [Mycena vulgaris]